MGQTAAAARLTALLSAVSSASASGTGAVVLPAVALALASGTGAVAERTVAVVSEIGAVLVRSMAHMGQTGLHVVKHTSDWTLSHKPHYFSLIVVCTKLFVSLTRNYTSCTRMQWHPAQDRALGDCLGKAPSFCSV